MARNPWLDIPLADYEAHMALPEVGQAALLADALAAAVEQHAPRSVAVLGCAGGNGFERVPRGTRLVGVDLNAAYLDVARSRFGDRHGLELYCADVVEDALPFAPVDLAFAGLLFEYTRPGAVLDRLAAKLEPRGVLIAVLQLPSTAAPVTPSPYASLSRLAASMRLVSPDALALSAAAHDYSHLRTETVTASGGKQFAIQTYRRDREGH